MSLRFYTFICCLFLISSSATAQQFINGGLEPTIDTGVVNCDKNNLSLFNTIMGNVTATGSQPQIFIGDTGCVMGAGYGLPHFVGLLYTGTSSNVIIFKLNKPMTVGTNYTVEFFYEYQSGTPSCPLRYGYSLNGSSPDSFLGSVNAPPTTNWARVSESFTPLGAGQYIWVASDLPTTGTGGITYVDSFHMKNIPDVGVNEISFTNGITVSPNPFTSFAKLSIDEQVELPCTLVVYDITGRLVLQKLNINSREVIINKQDLGEGMYFIKMNDKQNRLYCGKLVAQ